MAATNEQIISFINIMGPLCVAECARRIHAGLGFIIPSVVMAQSAHETGWGTSPIMTKAKAFFGIKAGSSWTGKTFDAETWEVYDGVNTTITATFRAYDSLMDSVADYYNLTVNNARYAAAVSYAEPQTVGNTTVFVPKDVKSAYDTLYAIWAGGYATDENYVPNVMNLLNGRDLTQWDKKIIAAANNGDVGEYVPPVVKNSGIQYLFTQIKTE